MKNKIILYLLSVFATFTFMASCANDDTAADTNEVKNTDTSFDILDGCTAFCMESDSTVPYSSQMTRTSMRDHQYLGGGNFMWETGDKIWVEDGSSRTASTKSSITASQPSARFYVPGNYSGNSYRVYYTGENSSSGTNVTIKGSQTQDKPNSTRHFGTSGDCGTATAIRNGGRFKFSLDHKAAYLCLMPRIENAGLAKNVYLTQVVVKSDNNIAGSYTLNFNGLSGNGNSNIITLTTKGGSSSVPGPWDTHTNQQRLVATPGFPISSVKGDVSKSAYMVIAPGTHRLTVEYTIKDPATEIEATITKQLSSKEYLANKVYDITANLTSDIQIYQNTEYYMWDPQIGYNYWKYYETSQPYVHNGLSNNYPRTSGDPRFYSENWVSTNATRAFQYTQNVNELIWYVWKGNPHWDGNKLWSHLKHLYKGGMWFKKKQYISNFNNSQYAGIDYRNHYKGWNDSGAEVNQSPAVSTIWEERNTYWRMKPIQNPPANVNEYFFLPAMGYYSDGKLKLKDSAYYGVYWSSTVLVYPFDKDKEHEGPAAFCLHFDNQWVGIDCDSRRWGYVAGPSWFL